MVRRGLLEIMGSSFRGKKIEHYVAMPALVIVDNLELALKLRSKYDSRQYLVIHSPELLREHGSNAFKIGRQKITGKFISGKEMRQGMAYVYSTQDKSSVDVIKTLASLEESVQEAAAVRSQNMAVLEQAAKSMVLGGQQDRQQLLDLIYKIVTQQFELPEYFIREAIQNADGASPDKKRNKINVYLDPVERIIRIEDNGGGMSQDVMNNVFFNLYASLNEALNHAAGKFGIGAISFFGLKHEYVKVDSKPVDSSGGIAIVDAQLNREDNFKPTQRKNYGTTIEIKLSAESDIDFERIVQILTKDCCYVETPIYLHSYGKTTQINKQLTPKKTSDTLPFQENNLKGFLTRTDGESTGESQLDILGHRIRLNSIPARGYSGAVNCNALDTTFSRDTVFSDPVLKGVLEYVEAKRRELRPASSVDLHNMSLEARLNRYNEFTQTNLFNKDRTVNEQFIIDNFGKLTNYYCGININVEHKLVGIISYLFAPFTWLYDSAYDCIADIIKPNHKREHRPSNMFDEYYRYRAESTGMTALALYSIGGLGYNVFTQNNPTLIAVLPSMYFLAATAEVIGSVSYHLLKHCAEKEFVKYYYNRHYGGFVPGASDERQKTTIKTTKLAFIGLAVGALSLIASYGINIASNIPETPCIEITSKSGQSQESIPRESLDHRVSDKYPAPSNSSPEKTKLPWQALIPVMVMGAGAAVYLNKSRNQKKLFEPYAGSLNNEEQQALGLVKAQLGVIPEHVDVYFGNNLGSRHNRAYMAPGTIVLNPRRFQEISPSMIALAYATSVRKDADLAQRVAAEMFAGEK